MQRRESCLKEYIDVHMEQRVLEINQKIEKQDDYVVEKCNKVLGSEKEHHREVNNVLKIQSFFQNHKERAVIPNEFV